MEDHERAWQLGAQRLWRSHIRQRGLRLEIPVQGGRVPRMEAGIRSRERHEDERAREGQPRGLIPTRNRPAGIVGRQAGHSPLRKRDVKHVPVRQRQVRGLHRGLEGGGGV